MFHQVNGKKHGGDRFIPLRMAMNLDLFGEHGNTSGLDVDVDKDTEFVNYAKIRYNRQKYQHQLRKILLPLDEKVLNFFPPKQFTPTYHNFKFSEGWPVKPRRKPVIGPPEMVLDMPQFDTNISHHVADWSSKNCLATIFEREVHMWYPDSEFLRQTTTTQKRIQHCVKWKSEGTSFAVGLFPNGLGIWDILTKKLICETYCCLVFCEILCLEWISDNYLITGCNKGFITMYTSSLEFLRRADNSHHSIVNIASSCNKEFIAVSSMDKNVCIWKMPELRCYFRINCVSIVRALAWHPWKNSTLAIGHGKEEGRVLLWNISNCTEIARERTAYRESSIDALTFNPISGELVSYFVRCTRDIHRGIGIISVLTNIDEVVEEIHLHNGPILYLLWGNEGKTLAYHNSTTMPSYEPSRKWKYSCKYPKCENRYYVKEKNKHFYKFPKDILRLDRWKQICNIPEETNCTNFNICEDHFIEEHFVNATRHFLNPHAVPVEPCTSLIEAQKSSESHRDEEMQNVPVFLNVRLDYDLGIQSCIEIGTLTKCNQEIVTANMVDECSEVYNANQVNSFEADDNKEANNISQQEKSTINQLEETGTIKKPYLKSVLSYIQESDSFAEVCRICFRSLIDEEMIKLNKLSEEEATEMKDMIKSILPDLDFDMYPNIVFCTNCVQLVSYSYQLKNMWIATERKLQKIIKEKKGLAKQDVSLVILGKKVEHDILKKSQHTSSSDHTYVASSSQLSQSFKVTDSVIEKVLVSSDNEDLQAISSQHDYVQTRKESTHCSKITSSVMKKILTSNNRNSVKIIWEKLQTTNSDTIVSTQKIDANKRIRRVRRKFMCEVCGRVLSGKSSLIKHVNKHTALNVEGTRKVMCEVCGRFFTSHKRMVLHHKIHSEQKCPICHEVFSKRSKLRTHVKYKHLQINYFQCHLCGKQFSYSRSLKTHLASHNPKSKTLPCHICDKKFMFRSSLQKHILRHISQKVICKYCGKSVKYEKSLQRHIRIFHMNQGEFICDFCHKPYWKRFDLDKHKVRVHGWHPNQEVSTEVVPQITQNVNVEKK